MAAAEVHASVRAMFGWVLRLQVAEAVLVTGTLVQLSVPVAITVLLTEHVSVGARKLAVNPAETPGARVGTVKTTVLGAGWLFTTVTLFKVTLPEFFTVPL